MCANVSISLLLWDLHLTAKENQGDTEKARLQEQEGLYLIKQLISMVLLVCFLISGDS